MTQQQLPRNGGRKKQAAAKPAPTAAKPAGKAAAAPAKPVPLSSKPAPKATAPAPKAATPAPKAAAPVATGKPPGSVWGSVPASVKGAAPTLPTVAATTGTAAPATPATPAAAPAPAPAAVAVDPETLKPQAGRKPAYTLSEARTELAKYHHAQKATGLTKNQRKAVAKAWGDYILTNLAGIKAGKVRDTYKSSWDHGDPEEFSVSQEIDGIPEIVIHAHMDKAGKAKGGNGVHWKWSDKKGEKMPETYEMSGPLVAKLLDDAVALKAWQTTGKAAYLAKIALPTVATGGTPAATAATPATPAAAAPPPTPAAASAAPAPTVTLPTTGTKKP